MSCSKGKAVVPGQEVAMPCLSTRTALKVIEQKKDTTAYCDPRDWKDIQDGLREGDSGEVDGV